jgi:1-acyl-sn-glycerol-3-phosphate acyltransferase
LCLNHRSNLDVPTLYTLLEDHDDPELFHRIIWIAGRKLEEDEGMTGVLIQCVNRVIVTPHSWFAMQHTDGQMQQARIVNIAAERAIVRLRREGWVFALFPTGTRMRPGNASTQQAIGETYSYLRVFENLVLCHIDGCTLPVSRDRDFLHETPRLDRVIYTFGKVRRTEDWLTEALRRYSDLDQRSATARAMIADIEALAPEDLAEDPHPLRQQ